MKGATWSLKETNRNADRKAAYKRQLTASIKVIVKNIAVSLELGDASIDTY